MRICYWKVLVFTYLLTGDSYRSIDGGGGGDDDDGAKLVQLHNFADRQAARQVCLDLPLRRSVIGFCSSFLIFLCYDDCCQLFHTWPGNGANCDLGEVVQL